MPALDKHAPLVTLRGVAESDDKTPSNSEDSFEAFDDEENFPMQPAYVEVPPVFHSFLEEGPFTKCTVCEAVLDGYDVFEHLRRTVVCF